MPQAHQFWPTEPRAFVAYRPPIAPQPARSASPRAVWADVQRFLDRAARPYRGEKSSLVLWAQRWSAESAHAEASEWLGEWPAECTHADFDAAVRLACDRFGSAARRADTDSLGRDGLEEEHWWLVPVERVDEVLEYLERVPRCTGGSIAPVHASYTCLFELRDLETGEPLPGQGTRHLPAMSQLTVYLQRSSTARLLLLLPFDQPDEALANYVVALQEHAPVWLDPRYFDYMAPMAEAGRYDRVRLPPEWVGMTASGALRLDPARSGITPAKVDLPSVAEMATENPTAGDGPFYTNYAAVEAALREDSLDTLLIRGPREGATRYMVEQAAERLGIVLHVVQSLRLSTSPTFVEELRAVVAGSDARRTLLLVEVVPYADRETNAAILSQMASRVLLGVELPETMRLVVTEETEPGDATAAAWDRAGRARDEGFLTWQQSDFLLRQARRAAYREVVIRRLPSGKDGRG